MDPLDECNAVHGHPRARLGRLLSRRPSPPTPVPGHSRRWMSVFQVARDPRSAAQARARADIANRREVYNLIDRASRRPCLRNPGKGNATTPPWADNLGLVHPVHQAGRVFGWELKAPLSQLPS